MDHLMQANLQIIELLGAILEEAERHGARDGAASTTGRAGRPSETAHVGIQTTTH